MTQFDIIPCAVCGKEFQTSDLVGHLENVHDWVDTEFFQLSLINHCALLGISDAIFKRLERLEK